MHLIGFYNTLALPTKTYTELAGSTKIIGELQNNNEKNTSAS